MMGHFTEGGYSIGESHHENHANAYGLADQ